MKWAKNSLVLWIHQFQADTMFSVCPPHHPFTFASINLRSHSWNTRRIRTQIQCERRIVWNAFDISLPINSILMGFVCLIFLRIIISKQILLVEGFKGKSTRFSLNTNARTIFISLIFLSTNKQRKKNGNSNFHGFFLYYISFVYWHRVKRIVGVFHRNFHIYPNYFGMSSLLKLATYFWSSNTFYAICLVWCVKEV